jgi:1,6-anhydro-N-acetylmuramate kinase
MGAPTEGGTCPRAMEQAAAAALGARTPAAVMRREEGAGGGQGGIFIDYSNCLVFDFHLAPFRQNMRCRCIFL